MIRQRSAINVAAKLCRKIKAYIAQCEIGSCCIRRWVFMPHEHVNLKCSQAANAAGARRPVPAQNIRIRRFNRSPTAIAGHPTLIFRSGTLQIVVTASTAAERLDHPRRQLRRIAKRAGFILVPARTSRFQRRKAAFHNLNAPSGKDHHAVSVVVFQTRCPHHTLHGNGQKMNATTTCSARSSPKGRPWRTIRKCADSVWMKSKERTGELILKMRC